MIATQLLLCQGALAMPAPSKGSLPVMCSPRGVLLEARRDISGTPGKPSLFSERIAHAQARTTRAHQCESRSANGHVASLTRHHIRPFC